MTGDPVLAERLAAQGLSGPPLKSPATVAERLLAVQGQDPRGARLAVRARTTPSLFTGSTRRLSEEGVSPAEADRGVGVIEAALADEGPLTRVQLRDRLVDLAKRSKSQGLPPPKLLGAFDPVLLGWTSREPILGPHTHLVMRNGIFRPFAMVGGKAVATWKLAGGKVTIEHLGRVTKDSATALDVDAAEVEGFMTRGEAAIRSTR